MNTNSDRSSHIPVAGVLFLVMLSFLWGANMVSIRFSNQGVSPILAATIRSVVASFLLWLYARYVSEKVFLYGGDLKHGIVIGVLFGVEFLVLYWGHKFHRCLQGRNLSLLPSFLGSAGSPFSFNE